MGKELLKDLFRPREQDSVLSETEERQIFIHFKYCGKYFCTSISGIKEIIDLPLFIPFPVITKGSLGVFNMRGGIVPIMDPNGCLSNILNEHKSKAYEVFKNMKLRLIVFENEEGGLVSIPVSEVGKAEINQEEMNVGQSYVEINGLPHEKFDLGQLLEN